MSVCVVLLNWNGWADTVECLESVFRSRAIRFQVVVCDNDSQDDSVERLRAWAEGRLDPPGGRADHALSGFVTPPVAKPIPYAVYDRATAEAGGAAGDSDAPLILVRTGDNLGFAGGCNVGIRFALARGVHEHVWLLNNDTIVHPDALRALVDEAARRPGAGMVGSTLLYHSNPEVVQALGGARYNAWLALSRHIGAYLPAETALQEAPVDDMAYVVGASMLVRRDFVLDVGLLSEEYFLFFEELDWAMRARGRWALGYAPESVVYHKEGATIGGNSRGEEKSWTADYYFVRNRIVFTRKYLPTRLPSVYLALGVAAFRRVARGQWARAWMVVKLCWST